MNAAIRNFQIIKNFDFICINYMLKNIPDRACSCGTRNGLIVIFLSPPVIFHRFIT